MIRRAPTLIPMNDTDIQDVRNLVAKQKAEATAKQQITQKIQGAADKPYLDEDELSLLKQLNGAVSIKQERERRLGIEPGESCDVRQHQKIDI